MEYPTTNSSSVRGSSRSDMIVKLDASQANHQQSQQQQQYANQNFQMSYPNHQLLPAYADPQTQSTQQQQHQRQSNNNQDQVQQVQQQLENNHEVNYAHPSTDPNVAAQFSNLAYNIPVPQPLPEINSAVGAAVAVVAAAAAVSRRPSSNLSATPTPTGQQQHQQANNGTKKLPRATLEQKIQVLDWHNSTERKCQQHTVTHFKNVGLFSVTKSTLNRWVLGERELRESYKNLTLNNTKIYKTRPKYRQPEIHRCLEVLYEQSCNEDHPITERELIEKWSHLYKEYHQTIETEAPPKSNGWLHHFKKSNSVKRDLAKYFHNNIQKANGVKTVGLDQERLKMKLAYHKPNQIYQIDEISFNIKPTFINGNDDDQVRTNGLSIIDPSNKVTVALLANADGSRFFDPLIVSDEPSLKEIKYPNLFYSKNGLLTAEIFYKYICYVDSVLTAENNNSHNKCILLLDDLYSHVIPTDNLQTIRLEYFSSSIPPPCYQYYPLDFGIKRIFKTLVKLAYIQSFRNRLLSNNNNSNNNLDKYQLHKSELIQYIMGAAASMQTKHSQPYISYSFYKSGIVSNYDNPPQDISGDDHLCRDRAKEEQLNNILIDFKDNQMMSRLFINRSINRINQEIDIDNFLFPEDEEVYNVHLSDTDVISLVKREFESESDFSRSNSEASKSEDTAKVTRLNHTIRLQQEYLHSQDFYDQNSFNHQSSSSSLSSIPQPPFQMPLPQRNQRHQTLRQSSTDAHSRGSSIPTTDTSNASMPQGTSPDDLKSLNSIRVFFSKQENIAKYPDLAVQFYKYFPNSNPNNSSNSNLPQSNGDTDNDASDQMNHNGPHGQSINNSNNNNPTSANSFEDQILGESTGVAVNGLVMNDHHQQGNDGPDRKRRKVSNGGSTDVALQNIDGQLLGEGGPSSSSSH